MSIDFEKACARPGAFSADELVAVLTSDDAGLRRDLFAAADRVKIACGKEAVLPRGLIEISNICAKDCFYCGIRRSQLGLERYCLDEAAVFAAIAEARHRGYPAVAFQGGEIESARQTAFVTRLLAACSGLEVTLSLGEQEEDVYRQWREAGALRYLLRIETSNRKLYGTIHPETCSFDRRLDCIRTLKRLGYVTGSGVMVGLPRQTMADLAQDILFFAHERLDMVGQGPFIPTPGTPLYAAGCVDAFWTPARRFETALRMLALTRLHLHTVNIVAATALEALDPQGREKGIAAGANVIMPNLTPPTAARHYALYPHKY